MASTRYEMYFVQGLTRIQIPVLPEIFNITSPSQNKKLNVDQLGDIKFYKPRGLTGFSWSSEFPAFDWQAVSVANLQQPINYVQALQIMRDNKRPIRFVITNTPINVFISIESFDFSEQGGDVGTIYYNISLEESRSPSLNEVEVIGSNALVPTGQERPNNRITPNTYTVTINDNWATIAKKVTGNTAAWQDIARSNGKQAPYVLEAGEVLTIGQGIVRL